MYVPSTETFLDLEAYLIQAQLLITPEAMKEHRP